MSTLTTLLAQLGETLGPARPVGPRAGSRFQRPREALLAIGLLGLLALAVIVARAMRREPLPGRYRIALPALLPRTRRDPARGAVRHAPFLLFLAGLPLFILALAAPHVSLVEEETTYPGHRITILIDASLSMNSAFSTRQLRAGNTFLANVSAAEYFVRRRMDGPYHDLVALIEFGSQAYIVTPFTNDYENILLSIGLIGTPEEYRRFPDHGTLIMGAINRGVQLFRTFDFLDATGNLIVIFSDGQDTHAVYEDQSLDEILQEASDNADSRVFHPHELRPAARRSAAGRGLEGGGGAHRRAVLSGGQRRDDHRGGERDRSARGGADPRDALRHPRSAVRAVRGCWPARSGRARSDSRSASARSGRSHEAGEPRARSVTS